MWRAENKAGGRGAGEVVRSQITQGLEPDRVRKRRLRQRSDMIWFVFLNICSAQNGLQWPKRESRGSISVLNSIKQEKWQKELGRREVSGSAMRFEGQSNRTC